MRISLDGFDNTIACSDLELANRVCIPSWWGWNKHYYISHIDREHECVFLSGKGTSVLPVKFDDLVELNAFVVKNR